MKARVFVCGLLFATFGYTSALHTQTPHGKKLEHKSALMDRGYLRIWNLAGSVHVTTWDKDSLLVQGSAATDVDFYCGGSLSAAKCGVDLPGKDPGLAVPADLNLTVPRHLRLWIKTASADVTVNGFDGSGDIYSVTGRITVSGHAQNMAVESMAGDITVNGSAGTLRLKSASGNIRVTGSTDDADVSSVSGGLALNNLVVQRGRFESIDGDVAWRGPIVAYANLEFSSHSGTVELTLPAASAGDFTITTYQGSVQNGFGSAKLVQARELNGRELHFTLRGDERTHVVIRNFKGRTIIARY